MTLHKDFYDIAELVGLGVRVELQTSAAPKLEDAAAVSVSPPFTSAHLCREASALASSKLSRFAP
jgi:hypothetical protein